MLKPITIEYAIRPKRRSLVTGVVSDLFGLAAAEPPITIAKDVSLDVQAGDVVLFTGPSGSGKSSLLRAVAAQLQAVDAMSLALPEVPLVEALTGPLNERLSLLAACGLSEARLLLRTPSELSDGQRYRFRIAVAIGERRGVSPTSLAPEKCRLVGLTPRRSPIALDEFTAMLDRSLAKVVAYNLRKLAIKRNLTILAATTHDDIVEDLQPSLHVQCHGEGEITMQRYDVKKKISHSPMMYGSRRAPQPTGRTSHGGITARTTSPSPAR